jgi:pyrimidine-nucleoside phosphorylase
MPSVTGKASCAMNIVDIICKKRDGGELSADEIAKIVISYVRGDVPDYQMSAWAMAVVLRGMTAAETAALTLQMLRSGLVLEWADGDRPRVDKHSTGGIGDKVSLVLVPLLACCDVYVPMLSGRGLAHTGGTLDKLEAIFGLRCDLSIAEIQDVCRRVGCVISGTTEQLVPADRKLYALRGVTGAVHSIPLITASIVSKKLAEGLDALALDVKWGSGALMKSIDDATALAESLVDTAVRLGLPCAALITDMNQPLGRTAGNTLELNEAIAALRGEGCGQLMELTIELATEVLAMVGQPKSRDEARNELLQAVSSGRAWETFCQMVSAQGGDLDAPRRLASIHDVLSPRSGFVSEIDAERLGGVIVKLGGGRGKLADSIDPSVGLEFFARLGDRVDAGQPLARVYAQPDAAAGAKAAVVRAFRIDDHYVKPPPLIAARIESSACPTS